jgi:cystathionine beta-lyase/cystathionine gamma-synthase
MGKHTDLIHRGEPPTLGVSTPLTTPVYATSTFVFPSAGAVEDYQAQRAHAYLYSRYENPTVVAVEETIAALDGAEASLLFGSGMAAVATALIGLTRAGDEIVCGASIYGGTFHVITDILARFDVSCRFVPVEAFGEPAPLIGPRTRVLWFESPTNPTLRCVDIEILARACRRAGVITVADNTFASPINQPVIALGVDLSMQSATKYLGGHSDLTAGVLSGPRDLIAQLAKTRRLLGGILDPQPASALGRSLKTLPLRIARHNSNALALAQALEGHAALRAVYYPGLRSHPDHVVASRQMSGFGGIVTIDLAGGQPAAYGAFDRLQVIRRAVSLGGVESLCSLPILSSQYGLTEEELAGAGVTPGMMRLSIGLEDAEDLIADIRQALQGE